MTPDTGPADLARTERTTVKRRPDRGSHDRDAADAILDEGLVAHVGIAVEGQPFVLPMAYGRDGDRLLLHGSVASRLMRGMAGGLQACVTVTLLDGLVLARSAFHHSMNYRSVMILGTAHRIEDPDRAAAALDVLVDHLVPGRSAEARPGSPSELRQTAVLEMAIEEASVKVRTGGVSDDEEDLTLPVWAGVLPLHLAAAAPEPDDLSRERQVSPSVASWSRPTRPVAG